MVAEGVAGRWSRPLPDRPTIVVIRLHAFGDTVITLPVIGGLRSRCPTATIVVVTGDLSAELFEATPWVDQVLTTSGSGSGYAAQVRGALAVARGLGRADLVIDLQRSRASRMLRRLLRPTIWVAFDRFAPRHALERYMDAVDKVVTGSTARFDPPMREPYDERGRQFLRSAGWNGEPLACLNPAGCWTTKNWPLDRYVELGRALLRERGMRTVLLGTSAVVERAAILASNIEGVFNLVGRTSPAEALAVTRHLSLMVSDDSGLMHMAWVCGVPTIAVFGATRPVWSAPLGPRSTLFDSRDMACGPCMSPVCSRGDFECLNRVGIERVLQSIG